MEREMCQCSHMRNDKQFNTICVDSENNRIKIVELGETNIILNEHSSINHCIKQLSNKIRYKLIVQNKFCKI